MRRALLAGSLAGASAMLGCSDRTVGTVALGDHQPAATESTADQPPVAINPVTPMVYPPALLDQGIEGRVLLRLFVDAQGTLVPDSTRVAESSGYPALDSAALTGSTELRFSPALRNGRPVAAPFLQPVHFRHPRSQGDP
jgi:TonB family protein